MKSVNVYNFKEWGLDFQKINNFEESLHYLTEMCNEIIDLQNQKPLQYIKGFCNLYFYGKKKYKLNISKLSKEQKLLYSQLGSSINKIGQILKDKKNLKTNYIYMIDYINEFKDINTLLINKLKKHEKIK